jgi:hypothetical protein
MGEVTTRNMYSSSQKYNKLYIDPSCWTIIDIKLTTHLRSAPGLRRAELYFSTPYISLWQGEGQPYLLFYIDPTSVKPLLDDTHVLSAAM